MFTEVTREGSTPDNETWLIDLETGQPKIINWDVKRSHVEHSRRIAVQKNLMTKAREARKLQLARKQDEKHIAGQS